MLNRRLGILIAALSALSALAALVFPAAVASAATRPVLTVGGTVATPASYTMSQLSALPAETVTIPVAGHRVQAAGVSLDRLVTLAAPVLPAAKNALLRVLVTASGPAGHSVTFALGELDPNFGNHDAVLVLSVNGRALPDGDVKGGRYVSGVDDLVAGTGR